jgi:hypothetical protein
LNQVERHLRLIDLAIKEQKESIALGVRAGTQIALPDVPPPPRIGRQNRIAMSPDLEGDDFVPELPPSQLSDTILMEAVEAHSKRIQGKKSRRQKDALQTEEPEAAGSLKITLPPLAQRADEELFCLCNQVSYGDVSEISAPHNITLLMAVLDDWMR